MDNLAQVFTFVLVIGGFIGIRWLMYKLDCDRIRENVAEHGGTVSGISYQLFRWGWGSTRIYDVEYTTAAGRAVSASCATSMFAGVRWLQSAPPGSRIIEDRSPTEDTLATPPEPVSCLACGAKIPSSSARCPNCGWSYRAQAPS